MVPHAHLKLVVEVAGKYGLQPQELNISLTAVGLLVSREFYSRNFFRNNANHISSSIMVLLIKDLLNKKIYRI